MPEEIVFQVFTKTGINALTLFRREQPNRPDSLGAYKVLGKWAAGSGDGGMKAWYDLKKMILAGMASRKGYTVTVETDFWKNISKP